MNWIVESREIAPVAVELPRGCEAERTYAAKVLLGEFLGLRFAVSFHDADQVVLRVAGGNCVRVADEFFSRVSDAWLDPKVVPADACVAELPAWQSGHLGRGQPLVFPFGRACETGWFSVSGDVIDIGVDIFGSAFFLLSRYEEAARACFDRHGRFRAEDSWQHRAGAIERALVNEYADLLMAALKLAGLEGPRVHRQYRFLPSHDVDTPSAVYGRSVGSVLRSVGADLLSRGSPSLAARRCSAWASRLADSRWDPYNTFDELMLASEQRGVASAFYFIPDGKHPLDGPYRLTDPSIDRLLRRIVQRGHEVGIHPGYGTCTDEVLLRDQVEALLSRLSSIAPRQGSVGGRQHYLQWQAPLTWRLWNEAGLAYDSSVGFAERAGFRAGTCYEYPVYDVVQRRELKLRERPLVVMDVTLTDHNYMGLPFGDACDCADRLVQACRRHSGDFTLLWHNSSLLTAEQRRLFRQIYEIAA